MENARECCKVQQQHAVAVAVARQARHWDDVLLEVAHKAWKASDERVLRICLLVTCKHISACLSG